MGELFGQCVDQRHDLVAAGDRQAAAGQEIILHIGDNEHVLGADGEGHGAASFGSKSSARIRPRTELPSQIASGLARSARKRTVSRALPFARSSARKVPGKRPEESGGVRSKPSFSTKTLVIEPSASSSRSLRKTTSSTGQSFCASWRGRS